MGKRTRWPRTYLGYRYRRWRESRLASGAGERPGFLDTGGRYRLESVDLADIEEGRVPGIIDQIARRVFYPTYWDREQAQLPPIIDHMVNCEGVTEADVRDMRYLATHDALVVRTWNWRKFYITGIHQHEHSIKHEQGRSK